MQIGLFFSGAGGLIERTVDLKGLVRHFSASFFVSSHNDFLNPEDLRDILDKVRQNHLEGVILIGDSPLNYFNNRSADLLLKEIENQGINPNKLGFVNLKEQLALAHNASKQIMTQKASLLIQTEIERVKMSEPLDVISVAPRKSVAIIGATAPGYVAAQQLLQKGFTVYIIEQRDPAGLKAFGDDRLKPIVTFVKTHPKYNFYSNATVTDIYGYAGDYTLEIESLPKKDKLSVGVILMANPKDIKLTRQIRAFLHIDVDENEFFKPRNLDTLLAYTSEKGIFLAHNNYLDLGLIVAAADSAVLAITELLERNEIKHVIAISEIDSSLCGGCGTCVKTCMFHACTIDPIKKIAIIDPKRCKGCGSCVTACPTGARDLLTYPQKYLLKAIDILSNFNAVDRKMLVFLCEGCGYRAMDAAATSGLQYPVGVLPLKVRCGGTIDTQLILNAFSKGFDGVLICKCQDGHCSNITGNVDLDRRANLFREVLRSRGINTEKLRIVDALQEEQNKCIIEINELYQDLVSEGGGECG